MPSVVAVPRVAGIVIEDAVIEGGVPVRKIAVLAIQPDQLAGRAASAVRALSALEVGGIDRPADKRDH